MSPAGWDSAARVLCVRLDTLGDVLMTTPAIRAIRESRAERHITLLTSKPGAAVAALVPVIDDVIVYEAPWMKSTPPRSGARVDLAMIERLRACTFDAAVIFTVYSQNPLPAALLCLLAGIPLRLAHCRENPYQLLTNWIRDPEPEQGIRHEVQRQLDLVAEVGCAPRDATLSLRVPQRAWHRASSLLRSVGVDAEGTWVVVHPGATAPSRRYPPELFARAAAELSAKHGMQIVFTGSAQEEALVDAIRGAMHMPSHSLAGRLSLADLAAVIARAPLLISNNTGPAHIAAAVGTPVVDLYALTNPQHTPWHVSARVLSHDVPCKYCYRSECPMGHHACLRQVAPRDVVNAALELLGTGQQRRRALRAAS
ncbi:MAG TPA: lipopolysaccharide heptosyltransferase II [Gemmatimonadaceae bacterium]|nr:lipopolysaccharide heptosyltransferase II [Gemmatimonadaceae bacterium]